MKDILSEVEYVGMTNSDITELPQSTRTNTDDGDSSDLLDSEDSSRTAQKFLQSKEFLDSAITKLQIDVQQSMSRLSAALKQREKQLLRQLEALKIHQMAILQSDKSALLDRNRSVVQNIVCQPTVHLQEEEDDLVKRILSLGKIEINAGNLLTRDNTGMPSSFPYKIEDYQDANSDHVCLYKSVSSDLDDSEHVVRFRMIPHTKGLSSTHQSCSDIFGEASHMTSSPITMLSSEALHLLKESESDERAEESNEIIAEKHPAQVEEWLQQIKAETETEPSIAEQDKQFMIISYD